MKCSTPELGLNLKFHVTLNKNISEQIYLCHRTDLWSTGSSTRSWSSACTFPELPLQSQHKIGQDLIGEEPCYDWSWLAAGGRAVTVGMSLAKSSLADTHNPGWNSRKDPRTSRQVLSTVFCLTMGKEHSPTTPNPFNWVNLNMRGIAKKSTKEHSTSSMHIQACCF